jgi:hypothetical protein
MIGFLYNCSYRAFTKKALVQFRRQGLLKIVIV